MPRHLGRPKGAKNKTTIERNRIAAEIAARTVIDAKTTGKKLAKEVLDDLMHLFVGMAAHHQPTPPGAPPVAGARPDEARFEKYARLALETARALASYQSPTFRAIVVAPAPDANQPEQRKRFTLTIFEGGKPPPPMIEQKANRK